MGQQKKQPKLTIAATAETLHLAESPRPKNVPQARFLHGLPNPSLTSIKEKTGKSLSFLVEEDGFGPSKP